MLVVKHDFFQILFRHIVLYNILHWFVMKGLTKFTFKEWCGELKHLHCFTLKRDSISELMRAIECFTL